MTTNKSTAADTMRGKGLIALAACALIWSTGGLFIKLVPWNPLAIAGARSFIGAIVLLIYLKRPHFTWSSAQIIAAVAYAATMITFVASTKLTTAANAILLQYTAPLYAALLGALVLKERTHWFDWLTIGIVMGGMVLFFMDKLSLGGMWGNLLAIVSGVVFAFSIVFLRKQKQGSPLESMLLSHIITFVVTSPFLVRAVSESSGSGLSPQLLTGFGALLVLGVFQVGISCILLSYGVRHVTAVQSLLTAVLEPIFNPIWVFIFLGERPGPLALVGGAIILVTVTARSFLTVLGEKRARFFV
jgi:drug/metabolite transporter (DMT)-like permease